jgi:DNA polymerase/3'-5' exonuclease PolX
VSTGVRVPLVEARQVADELVARLAPSCERITVAGSIRRGRPDVGDVELVAVPRYGSRQVQGVGLFDGPHTERIDYLAETVDLLLAAGVLAPHPTDPKRGERYSKLLEPRSGLQVDLFTARPETFGLILLMRTGPAAYSQRLVTQAKRRGHHVADGELHKGGLGRDDHGPCVRVPTPEEADVYRALGLPFVEPGERA